MSKQDKPQLKYMHLRSDNQLGATTVGFSVDTENKMVYYTVAKCCPWDNFSRKIGRSICQGRFVKGGDFIKSFAYTAYAEIKKELLKLHPDYIEVVPTETSHSSTPLAIFGDFSALDAWGGYGP